MRPSLFRLRSSLAFILFCSCVLPAQADSLPSPLVQSPLVQSSLQDLPKLGDRVSAVISQEKEQILGQAWLRALRGQAPLISDPLLNDYLENLIYQLAAHSELESPNLELAIINDASINAFAVPGGILGANAGLFMYAETEDELAAVLAHELAHLSQRHFARNLEKSRREQWTTMAALLASVAIMASSGSADTGLAALATTQAAALQSQLSFSRQNEQEADRIGMVTLAKAGWSPRSMPAFFERMHKATRFYGDAPPEFLLTHPVTESRISDSFNRVMTLPRVTPQPSLQFALMKARVASSFAQDKLDNVKKFQAQIPQSRTAVDLAANQYGLARSLLKVNQYPEALKALAPLREKDPSQITYMATEAEIYMAHGDYAKAAGVLEQGLKINPGNYVLSIYYTQVLLRLNKTEQARDLAEAMLIKRPKNPQLWRLLSEAYGETGDIVGVHQARAEVFFLHNRTDQAIQQLKYALNLAKEDFPKSSRIKLRIQEIKAHKEDLRI